MLPSGIPRRREGFPESLFPPVCGLRRPPKVLVLGVPTLDPHPAPVSPGDPVAIACTSLADGAILIKGLAVAAAVVAAAAAAATVPAGLPRTYSVAVTLPFIKYEIIEFRTAARIPVTLVGV